jgi:hypothetical protein
MHVGANYHDMKTNKSFANHAMYMNSIGKHEDRIKNLFFIYAAIVKALYRAEPILSSYNYATDLDPL